MVRVECVTEDDLRAELEVDVRVGERAAAEDGPFKPPSRLPAAGANCGEAPPRERAFPKSRNRLPRASAVAPLTRRAVAADAARCDSRAALPAARRGAVALSAATRAIGFEAFDCRARCFRAAARSSELLQGGARRARRPSHASTRACFSSLDERASTTAFASPPGASPARDPGWAALTSIARAPPSCRGGRLVQETYVRGGVAHRDALDRAAFSRLQLPVQHRLRHHRASRRLLVEVKALEQLSRRAGGARHASTPPSRTGFERLPRELRAAFGIATRSRLFVACASRTGREAFEEIFDRAQSLAGVSADARCVHVGDSFALDVQGAVDAGFEAVWIAPPAKAVAAARGATPHLWASRRARRCPSCRSSGLE